MMFKKMPLILLSLLMLLPLTTLGAHLSSNTPRPTQPPEAEGTAYNSYVLGSSAPYSVSALNSHIKGAAFVDATAYGTTMEQMEQEVTRLVAAYPVENLVLSLSLPTLLGLDDSFSKPANSDAEPVGSLTNYLTAHPLFANFPKTPTIAAESAVYTSLNRLSNICALAKKENITLTVICTPVYADYWDTLDPSLLTLLYTRLAVVTPYWDFSLTPLSHDPRYFYDGTHFRAGSTDMILAQIFDDSTTYHPSGFGTYVTAKTAKAHFDSLSKVQPKDTNTYTASVPVLMYHHIDAVGNASTIITPQTLEAHLSALSNAGYTPIFPDALVSYVRNGKPLPDKPILLTFDDGYLSNYQYAFPLLQKYKLCATFFVVGATVGNTTYYKDTTHPITPHFSYAQGAEMVASGLVSLQSHTYDMHQWAPFETGKARTDILRWSGESEVDYRRVLKADCLSIRTALTKQTGVNSVHALAYPSGRHDLSAQSILLEEGFDTTFTIIPGSNTILQGQPQSLLSLRRYNLNESVSAQTILQWVSGKTT